MLEVVLAGLVFTLAYLNGTNDISKGIATLVARSVEGLEPENVTILRASLEPPGWSET